MIRRLDLKVQEKDKPIIISTVNGVRYNISKEVIIRTKLGFKCCNIEYNIVDNSPIDVVLGTNAIKSFGPDNRNR